MNGRNINETKYFIFNKKSKLIGYKKKDLKKVPFRAWNDGKSIENKGNWKLKKTDKDKIEYGDIKIRNRNLEILGTPI